MKEYKILSTLFLLLISTHLFSITEYKTGDSLFVWAKSGLNVRAQTNYKSSILAKILFGSRVVIVEKSKKTYNEKVISNVDTMYAMASTQPYIIKGNWAKIMTNAGKVGYVIDQYLLFIEPFDKTNSFCFFNPEIIKTDTLSKNTVVEEGMERTLSIVKYYHPNIVLTEQSNSIWSLVTITFENYTIEEVFVLLFSAYSKRELDRYAITRNWTNFLAFTDNEHCFLQFNEKGNNVIFKEECSF